MMHASNPIAYFTRDIGNAPNRTISCFLQGPLVLTYLDPAAEVEVYDGHPAKSDNDAPLVARLSGATFRGQFYVGHGQTIVATTPCATVSGYETHPELSRLENKVQLLREGGRLIYRPLGDSEISIPFTGDPTNSKLAAVREVETLLGCGIAVIHDWHIYRERWVLDFCVAPNHLAPKLAHVAPTPPTRNPDFIDPEAKVEVYAPEAGSAGETGSTEQRFDYVYGPFGDRSSQRTVFSSAWELLGSLCEEVARPEVSPGAVSFMVDTNVFQIGFNLAREGEQEHHFLMHYTYLFEPKPEGMPDALWRVFREDAHRMLDLAKLIEQGVPREGLAEALNQSAT